MTDQLIRPELPELDLDRADPGSSLPELRDQALALARELPGRLQRIRVAAGVNAVEIDWAPAPAAGPAPAPAAVAPVQEAAIQQAPVAAPEPAAPPAHAVTAPLVGTFYGAPAPGEPPFVKAGDTVRAGQQVGIVEAMKLMNTITADRAGTVRAVCVADGEMVEFDQVLVELVPAGNEG